MNTQPLGPNQEKWLTALESGRYKQGQKALHRESGALCCLGVECRLLRMKGTLKNHRYLYDNLDGIAPEKVVDALALRDSWGSHENLMKDSLVDFNDRGKTFAEIAQIVRADPAAYFYESR